MLRAIVKTYVVLSTLLILFGAGYYGVYRGLEYNPNGIYCDYDVAPEATNYVTKAGKPCKIRAWVFIEAGVAATVILLIVQFPAYLYFFVAYLLKPRDEDGSKSESKAKDTAEADKKPELDLHGAHGTPAT